MRRVKRTAITVKPKQWANGLEEGGVKLGEEFTPELNVYLVEDIAEAILDIKAIVAPHYKAIFEEELVAWHRQASDWPQRRDLATFLAWFEVEVQLHRSRPGGWLAVQGALRERQALGGTPWNRGTKL